MKGVGVGMTPKGFLSITLLRMNQNQPNFFYPSLINKKSVESFKKSSCPQNVGEGEGQSWKIVSKWSFSVVF